MPVPVTESAVRCFRTLLSISPSSVDGVVGRVAAIVLYNVDKVDPLPFWSDLVETHVKLRQVPKLLAKLLISVTSKSDDLSVRPLSRACLEPYCAAVRGLSLAQCADLWKTFLYHAGTSSDNNSVRILLEDFFPLLLSQASIVDHTVPRPTLDKFVGLLEDTREVAAGLPAVADAAHRLGVVLQRYRDVKLPPNIPANLSLEVAMLWYLLLFRTPHAV